MIYYQDQDITIRDLRPEDAQLISEGEAAQGWQPNVSKYEMRLLHQAQGKAIALAAEYRGKTAGYINLYYQPEHGPFAGSGIPEIVDFGVLEKYRRRGIGSKLMDAAEKLAGGFSDTVCIGVGLHSGYGNAQRMYVKRGYLPDGSGVWYENQPCPPYAVCRNNDELVLYLSKRLKG